MDKICTQCGFKGSAAEFVSGRNKCKRCRSKNEGNRQKSASTATLDIGAAKTSAQEAHARRATPPTLKLSKRKTASKPKKTELISFGDRDALDKYVREELHGSLGHLNDLIEANQARLRAAEETQNSKAIDEATKGLQRAVETKTATITTLMERLKLLDDLRAKSEKAKPVAFTFVGLAKEKLPTLVESRPNPNE